MKEYMYSYHYYRNRCVMRRPKAPDYIFQTVLFTGLAFILTTIFA